MVIGKWLIVIGARAGSNRQSQIVNRKWETAVFSPACPVIHHSRDRRLGETAVKWLMVIGARAGSNHQSKIVNR